MLHAIATVWSRPEVLSASGCALLLWWVVSITCWPTRTWLQHALICSGVVLRWWAIAAIVLAGVGLTPLPLRTAMGSALALLIIAVPILHLPMGWTRVLPPATFLRSWLRILLMSASVCILLQVATPARAQAAPDLIVTIHDSAGTALPGITVQLHASAGGPVLAQGVTDGEGRVQISSLSIDHVRVMVTGTLLDGTRLTQPGQDAQGIALLLGPPPTRLDLRVDPDGSVRPDPATMIDLVPNGPPIATPVAEPPQDGRMVFPTLATVARGSQAEVPGTDASLDAGTAIAAGSAPLAPPNGLTGAAAAAPASPTALIWLGWAVVGVAIVGGLLVARSTISRRRS